MSETAHCESCSRPIDDPGDFGAGTDGSRSTLYCSCCFAGGAFTEPDVTMEQMLERVIGIVTEHRIMSPEDARQKLPGYFKTLARWRG